MLNDGKPVPLTPKVFDTLKILIENAGRLLERDELMRELWQDSFVEEGNLTFNIKVIRKALGDDAAKPRFIETVQRRGYRFIAEVKKSPEILPAAVQTEKIAPVPPTQKPHFLIAIGIISLISMLGVSFVWFGGDNPNPLRQTKFTRLTTNGKVTNMAVSPDGGNVVFSQKEGAGESLWVRQIDTGSQTQILPPQEVEFIGLTISPDNSYVYYSVFSTNAASLFLSRIPLRGGSPEQIRGIDTDASVSFSPDGKKFAFIKVYSSLKETHLVTADADGSNQKILVKAKSDNRTFPIFRASPAAWSPDGETIACAIQETDENGVFYRLLLVNQNDGSEKYLSERRWNTIENVAWKDSENLLIIDYESSSPIKSIWQISRETGEARQLTDDLNGYQWLGIANGNLFTVQKNVFSSLHAADFAQNTNALQSKQVFGESSLIDNVAWSNDGRIFYNSWASGKNEIWQINPDGTASQRLTTNSNLIYSFAVSPIDNKFVFSASQNGKFSLSIADSDGQNIRQLTTGTMDYLPSYSPDGKNVVFQRGWIPLTLWRVATEENQPPVQLTGYPASHPSVSPDGQIIAYHFIDYGGNKPAWKLGLINSETRRLLNKLDFPVPITERKTIWHPNDNLLTMIFYNGENVGMLLMSATDGKHQIIDNIGIGKISSFAWSPDGSRLVFTQNFETNDVVSMGKF